MYVHTYRTTSVHRGITRRSTVVVPGNVVADSLNSTHAVHDHALQEFLMVVHMQVLDVSYNR